MDAIQAGAMKLRIECKLTAATRFDDAAGVHVAWCPALDIFSQGTSEGESKLALESALLMYLKHCVRRGILESVLEGRGFNVSDKPAKSDTSDSGEYISVRPESEVAGVLMGDFGNPFSIDVPLELIMQSKATGIEACPS